MRGGARVQSLLEADEEVLLEVLAAAVAVAVPPPESPVLVVLLLPVPDESVLVEVVEVLLVEPPRLSVL